MHENKDGDLQTNRIEILWQHLEEIYKKEKIFQEIFLTIYYKRSTKVGDILFWEKPAMAKRRDFIFFLNSVIFYL